MVVTNLPRKERFKRKNLVLVGIIPSMLKEPKTNTFLKPLVDKLLTGWNEGFCFNIPNAPTNPSIVRVALICVGCDIPACRKLCGFLGEEFFVIIYSINNIYNLHQIGISSSAIFAV